MFAAVGVGVAAGLAACFLVVVVKATRESRALPWDGLDELGER